MRANELDEEEIGKCFVKISDGDEEALAELYELSAFHIYRFALSIVKYSYIAEEVVQDVFVNIITYCGSNKVKKPKSWLFTVVKNCSIKALKKEHFNEKNDIDLYSNSLPCHDQTEKIDSPLSELECLRELDDEAIRLIILCKLES